MKEKLRKAKGITLIALVITIIVLLILAGVSIAMLTGDNGILTQTNNAKIQNSHGAVRDGISLAYNEWQIELNTASRLKLASTEVVQIQGKEERSLAVETDFIAWLVSKGYAESDGKLIIEKLTGSKQALGNGTEEKTDIYNIEKENGEYIVKYYETPITSEKIWSMGKQKDTEEDENLERVQINCWINNEKMESGTIKIYTDRECKNLIKEEQIAQGVVELDLDTGCYYVDFEDTVGRLPIEADNSFTVVKTNKNVFDFYLIDGTELPGSGPDEGLYEIGFRQDSCIVVKTIDDQSQPIGGAIMTVYCLGSQDEDETVCLFENGFENMGLKNLQQEDIFYQTRSLAKAMAEYAKNNVEHPLTAVTDVSGITTISFLEQGKTYLVTVEFNGKTYEVIVPLPWKELDNDTGNSHPGVDLLFMIPSGGPEVPEEPPLAPNNP